MARASMRPRIGATTLTFATVLALAACRTASPAAGTEGEGPAAPSALRAAAGPGAAVELMWQPSPTRGVVYAILDAQGKRVGLTARTRFRVSEFGIRAQRCYSVIALDRADRASKPTGPACLDRAAPAGGEARPPDREPEEPAGDQSSRPHPTPTTTSGALAS